MHTNPIFILKVAIMIKITAVEKYSISDRYGIMAGDFLASIDSYPIRDVLDYRFRIADHNIRIELKRGEDTLFIDMDKPEYYDIGLEFETPLMDKKRSCKNKCIFCFIDQLPKGMRDTLYFKDDDERLSFLQGNYITLTNLTDEDVDRICEMHISPINISVHTTDPELRCMMMNNKNAGKVLSYIPRIIDANIKIHGQIVLCRGINDRDDLKRTLSDMHKFCPSLESLSVVPSGLTSHREGLYPLMPFDCHEAYETIKIVEEFAIKAKKEHGNPIFYCSDEFYITAGLPFPDPEYYGSFAQLENGVGMMPLFIDEANAEIEYIKEDAPEMANKEKKISVATGAAAYPFIKNIVERIKKECYNIDCNVYMIKNNTFGEGITVSGLLCGKDIISQLKDKELGDLLLFPKNALRADGAVFLDDVTPNELSEELNILAQPTESDGGEFVRAILGISL